MAGRHLKGPQGFVQSLAIPMAITIRRRVSGEYRKLPEYRKLLVVSFFVAASVAPFARASTVYSSGGFEAPFTTGNLVGQQGWLHAGGSSTATVQTSVVQSGTQAVQVDRAAGSDDRFAVLLTGYSVASPVLIDWDMRVQQSGTNETFGPFFGISAYDDNGGSPRLIGSFGVDASTREVLYQRAGDGALLAPGPTVSFGAWNHFQLRLDFTTQFYSFYLNGAQVGLAEGFVDGLITHFTDADISALAAAGDSASFALTGTAYFDNYIISDASVPEPATWLFIVIGMAALWFRRRRSTI